jgi:uncharacterized surface protein with fasciclin (FAS1) repeats
LIVKFGPRPTARYARTLLSVLAIGALQLVVLLTATSMTATAQTAPVDLMETIRAEARFSTLVRAVEAAGLVETLKSPGPYTFFAPTNDAFNKLAPGTLDALLKDRETLRRVLTSHISAGSVTAAQAVQIPTLPDVNGNPIQVSPQGASVYMNESRVTQADLRASNGVIHVVDTVWTKTALNPQALPVAGEAEDRASRDTLTFAGLGLLLLAAGLVVTRRSRTVASR